ncbi:ribosome modulation factor [Mycobacteroides chelonae]|uniref:ribosome modulation factor n=1 Tax=Mycobacteroides chelonae TaxID=1774 RepID=UPI000D6A35C7|nr:hypothetical protein [Mycobacteroides chelonae]
MSTYTVTDLVRARAEGLTAEVGTENPYAGASLVLAQVWRRAYMTRLAVRLERSPGRQNAPAEQ